MNPVQIVRIVAIAVAVIGAFVAIPEAALIMAIIGLVLGGMAVDADRRTDFLVLTLVLAAVSSAASPIPVVGEYVSDIMANVSSIFNAGALAVIIMVIKDRLTE
ncbi:MAG: hypothetical protein P8M71_08915 [Pseudomonadales bacterium]|nr:hypothetical protein [Pseudomonadales bacterium]